jgi:peptidyl-prolyl cis-trans isomerase SurA
VAALGVSLLLSACSPVQVGAAAIVGNQRITQSTLDTQVSSFNDAAADYPGQVQVTAAEAPAAVLTWLILFAIEDRMASDAGITVSQADIQAGTVSIEQQIAQEESQAGVSPNLNAGLLNVGLPPQMLPDLGKYQAQLDAFAVKVNGGKLPTTTAENSAVDTAVTKARCTAAKSLSIQVNPQYGQFNYTQYAVQSGTSDNTLSALSGPPVKPSTAGLTPAC